MSRYIRSDELHTGFNFSMLCADWCGAQWRRLIEQSLQCDGAVGAPTTWVTENHDWPRAATRYSVDRRLQGREQPTAEQLHVRYPAVPLKCML
jgi:alpha-glucosidase